MEKSETHATQEIWKVQRVGPTTFAISKPKRNPRKLRRHRLKNRRRAR